MDNAEKGETPLDLQKLKKADLIALVISLEETLAQARHITGKVKDDFQGQIRKIEKLRDEEVDRLKCRDRAMKRMRIQIETYADLHHPTLDLDVIYGSSLDPYDYSGAVRSTEEVPLEFRILQKLYQEVKAGGPSDG